jgi:hypothetical protein
LSLSRKKTLKPNDSPLCGDAEIAFKVAGRRRYPWERPADAFPVGFGLCRRSDRHHDADLGQVPAQRIDQRRALTRKQFSRAMAH